jgi:hypothetical protein
MNTSGGFEQAFLWGIFRKMDNLFAAINDASRA